MFRILLLAALAGPTINLPLPDAKIYFPDENIPIDPRGGYFHHSGQTHYTKSSHRKGGGFESPIQLPPDVGESGHSYGNPNHHGAYSSYGHHPHPHHLSYPTYSYGGAHHPHTFQSHPYGGSQSHGSNSGSVEGQIEQVSHGSGSLNDVNNWQETGNHVSHGVFETSHTSESNTHQIDESDSSYGQEKNPSAADVVAEEHHIIQEIEQLVGLTSQPGGITKNPITQQQEIIREINGLKDPQEEQQESAADLSHVNHETTIPPVKHYERIPNEPEEHHREVEAPIKKVTLDQGHQGAGHHETHPHTKATPDPLDLTNIYNDYVQGDFKPGHPKDTAPQPKKELKPEIKQAIDNIMKEWEVIPENEGKPQPPPRNYKITKHVKVTTTTHNHPVVVHPSQTITKTVQTHTFQPSTSHHHKVVTHHINIAELLEQLRQLESSPHHRNVTWCEEKIKEFLTELNRKEESGIEIDQDVQEETLHHILTQDQTITKEVRHEVEHEAVDEPPFVKKTVVELGQNEPTRPPSHWIEQHETNSSGHIHESGLVDGEEEKSEPHEISEESQIITVTPSPHNVQPLEALSHQSHASSKHHSVSDNDGDLESHGSESEGVTIAPIPPTPERPEIEEFRGETEREDRPLPQDYKPRERSEEENDIENEVEPKEDHKQIEELSIELPQIESSHEEGKQEEQKSAENVNVEREQTDEGLKQHHEEHVIHEINTGDQSPVQTEYVVESGDSNNGTITETVHNHADGGEGHSDGSLTEHVDETVEHTDHGHSGGGINTEYVEEIIHSSGGSHGHSGGGSQTEYVEETVEHNDHGHSGSGINTEYVEETIHHSSGGSYGHSGGGSQTEYVEETVEHHKTAGNNQINYDQLIEELISLESLPGHQAIDKCEEKIRNFLDVLRQQQERGFDKNQEELQRLRLLLQEIQAQKQNQGDSGANPEASNSFWKKIGRKIKTTFEKAKTKAHNTVNDMMS